MLWTPVTHAFLHSGWEHVLLNSVWFVVFATPLSHRYGARRMMLIFVLGAIVGAAAFAATTLPNFSILIGASGGVSALTGAAIRFIFQPILFTTDPQTGERIVIGRRLASIGEVFSSTRTRVFAIVWLVLNAVVPLIPMFLPDMQVEIAWQAHLGGFLAGFLLVPLMEKRQK
jgi:membrane associated rhomboid family serine protease